MIYAISAKKRTGKDCAGNFITESDPSVIKYALAEPIKQALWAAWNGNGYGIPFRGEKLMWTGDGTGFDREVSLGISHKVAQNILVDAWYWVLERKPEFRELSSGVLKIIRELPVEDWSIRRLMQVFGTDICVRVDENIWLKFMFDIYFHAVCDNMSLLITDCRQEHEIQFMRNLGAKVIFITRDLGEENVDDHITERGLVPKSGDTVVENNGTIEEFRETILRIIDAK